MVESNNETKAQSIENAGWSCGVEVVHVKAICWRRVGLIFLLVQRALCPTTRSIHTEQEHDSHTAIDIMKTYRVWQEEDKASGSGKWHVKPSGSQGQLSSKDLRDAPSYSLVFVLDTAKERVRIFIFLVY